MSLRSLFLPLLLISSYVHKQESRNWCICVAFRRDSSLVMKNGKQKTGDQLRCKLHWGWYFMCFLKCSTNNNSVLTTISCYYLIPREWWLYKGKYLMISLISSSLSSCVYYKEILYVSKVIYFLFQQNYSLTLKVECTAVETALTTVF